MTRNGICSACFLRRRRHCGKPVRPLRHGLCCAKFPFQGELGTKCQKGNWRHDVLNEGAPTDAANGCSPLIRLLPTVAATCSPSGTSCHLPRSGGVFPQGGKAFGKTANLTAPPKAPLGGAVAQRLRGNRSAEPEKTVKRSSRRRGVNLQFFPVEPTALGLSRASSP